MGRPGYVTVPILSVLAAIGYVYYTTVFLAIPAWLGLSTAAGAANAAAFTALAAACVTTYAVAVLRDPGRVPASFVPDVEDAGSPIHEIKRKRLWKCKVPPKVRVFWWRILNEYIPSRANLHRRHIDPLSTCDTCGACDETTFHALLECTYARQFWIRVREITGVKLPTLTPDSWSSDILEDRTCNEKERTIILCGMWSLWRSRNDRQHGKAPIDMRAAINWALDACFTLISVKENASGCRGPMIVDRWQRPLMNILKVNVDGAYTAEESSGAVGAVARDSDGNFLMATSRRLPDVQSDLAAEAEALREGVRMVHTVTTGSVVLESDSLELVSLWNKRAIQRSEFAPIFRDIEELAASFSTFSVVHARRSANLAAHACAKFVAATGYEGGDLRYCQKCSHYKPPRAHHCRVCKRCVLRMDHHCIWINNCVGHENYKVFLIFVLYAVIACFYSMVLIIGGAVHLPIDEQPGSNSPRTSIIVCGVLLCPLALALMVLLGWHVYLILHNKTTIEYHEGVRALWLAEKAGNLYHHPYSLGVYENLISVLGPNVFCWLCPISRNIGSGVRFRTSYDIPLSKAPM